MMSRLTSTRNGDYGENGFYTEKRRNGGSPLVAGLLGRRPDRVRTRSQSTVRLGVACDRVLTRSEPRKARPSDELHRIPSVAPLLRVNPFPPSPPIAKTEGCRRLSSPLS